MVSFQDIKACPVLGNQDLLMQAEKRFLSNLLDGLRIPAQER